MKLQIAFSLLFVALSAACSATQTHSSPTDLRVLTWNILHGGRDDGDDVGPERVIDVIRESNADIIALQETYGSGELLARELGFIFHPRGTNVSLLSRYPVLEDISVFEEFKCVGALIELPDASQAAVYSIWLPYDKEIWEAGTRDPSDTEAMLNACNSSARDLKQIHAQITQRLSDEKYNDVPIIIAGDFNSMSHLDYTEIARDQYHVVIDWDTSHILTDHGWRDSYRETHPVISRSNDHTWSPRFPEQEQDRIDFIYYKGNIIVASESRVISEHADKFPSDHAALLTTFRPREPQPETTTINAMTYNIRHGLGTDNKIDLMRSVNTLKNLKPDFVALQELDQNTSRSNNTNQAAFLAEQLNMHAAFGNFMPYDNGHYGIAILSHHPITNTRAIRLPDGNEPRIALAVDALLPNDQTVTVIAVHFDWVDDDTFRFAQAQSLADWIDQQTQPCILMGDFNDTPESRTLQLFFDRAIEAKKPSNNRFTFSSTDPEIEIDYIFAIPPHRWKASPAHITHDPLTSDHNPVDAALELLSLSTDQ